MAEQAPAQIPVQAPPAPAGREALPGGEAQQEEIYTEGLTRLPISRKLAVGAADDPLENEADQVADQVMRMPERSFSQNRPETPVYGAGQPDEGGLQRKPLAAFIQKKGSDGDLPVSDSIASGIEATRGGGEPLAHPARSFMESRFGSDFSDVRVHTGEYAAQLSTGLQAQAFTVGSDIYFNEGKYAPDQADGRHLLAHELTHTIQQGSGSSQVQRRAGDITKPDPSLTSEVEENNIGILVNVYQQLHEPIGDLEYVLTINGTTGHLYSVKSKEDKPGEYEKKLVATYPLKPNGLPPYFLIGLPSKKFAILGIETIEKENEELEIRQVLMGKIEGKTAKEKETIAEIEKSLTTANWFVNDKDKDDFNAKIDKASGFAVAILPTGGGATATGDGGKGEGETTPPMPPWMESYQADIRKMITATTLAEPHSTDIPDAFFVYYSKSMTKWRAGASQKTDDPKNPLKVYLDITEKDDKKAKFQEIRDKVRIRQLHDPSESSKGSVPLDPQLAWAYRLKLELDVLIGKEKQTYPSAVDLPDKTGITTKDDEPSIPYLKLWAYVIANDDEGKAASTLKTGTLASPLVQGTDPAQLLEVVKKATRALRGGELKPVSENPKEFKHVLAAFPANIESSNVRDDYRSVTGAELEMRMKLNMSVIGGMDLLNQVLTNYRGIIFLWDVYRISEVIPAEELGKMSGNWKDRRKELQAWFKESGQLKNANPVLKEDLKMDVDVLTPEKLKEYRNQGKTYSVKASYDDSATVNMPMTAGEYVVYCRAQTEPGDDVFRLPSEAFFTLSLTEGYELAKEVANERTAMIEGLTKELAEEKDDKKKKALQDKIDDLRKAEKRTLGEATSYNIGTQEETKALANKLKTCYDLAGNNRPVIDVILDENKKGKITDAEFNNILGLYQLIETSDLEKSPQDKLQEIIDNAAKNIGKMKELQSRIGMFQGDLMGYTILPAPVVGMVSRVTGQVYPLLLTIGVKQDASGETHVMLVDVTTHETQGKYEGSSSKNKDAGGLEEAVQEAFVEFGHKCKYGEGYLAYRIPENNILGTAESAPGTWEKIKHVLSIVAAVAGIAALIVGTIATGGALGVAAAYVGFAAMAVGAGLAIENIYDRASNHRLHADVELAIDILNIAGPVFQSAGALAKLSEISTLRSLVKAAEIAGEAGEAEKGVVTVGDLAKSAAIAKLGNLVMLKNTLMIIQKGEAITNLGLIGYKTYKDLAMVAEVYGDDPKKLAAMQAEIIKNAIISGTFALLALKNEFKIRQPEELDTLVNSLLKEKNYEAAMIKSGLKDADGNWKDPKIKEFFLGKPKEEGPPAKPGMVTMGGETFPEVLEPGQSHTFSDGAVATRLADGTLKIVSKVGGSVGRKHFETLQEGVGEMGLYGWVRAHSQGQGTGHENPYGILYAPAEVNEAYQNKGIEQFLRTLNNAVPEDYEITLTTYTTAHPGSNRLKSIAYKVDITNPKTKETSPAFEATINVADSTTNPKVTVEVTPFRIGDFVDIEPELTPGTPRPTSKNLGLVSPEGLKTMRRLNEMIIRLGRIARRNTDQGKAAKAYLATLRTRQQELLYKPEDYLTPTNEDLDSIEQFFGKGTLTTTTAGEYLKTLPGPGKKVADTQAEELILKAGKWKELIKTLQDAKRPDLVKKVLEFRKKLVDRLMKDYEGGLLGKPSDNPESDIDVNLKGENAGANLIKAEAEVQGLFGDGWSEAFRLNFYTEGDRLTLYKQVEGAISEEAAAGFEKKIAQTTVDYTIAKMLHHAEGSSLEADVRSMIKKLVPDRETGINSLAKNYEGQGIKRRNELLVEIDGLVKKYNAAEAGDKARIDLAQQITLKQMEANFYTTEAYIGPGSLKALSSGKALSGAERIEAVFSNLEMMAHIVKESGGSKLDAGREYELYKYMFRTSEAMNFEQMDLMYDYLTKQIYKVNREGMASASPGQVMGIYNDFMKYVMKYLEANISAVK